MSEIQIRMMRPEEAKTASELERECFPDPWSEDSIEAGIKGPHTLYLAAIDGDSLIGYLGTQLVLDEGEILRIAVSGERRGEKIGTQLLRQMLEQTPQTKTWNLDVREGNAPALGLYRKFGFEVIGRRKRYYRDPEEDAVLMQMQRGE